MIVLGADEWVAPLTLRELARTGLMVNPVALDGSLFGWASGVDSTAAILDHFRAAGGNLVSTADHYAGGRSEVMIGSWLRSVRDRSSVVVATKVGRHPDAPGLSQRSILRAVESSLERLGTDYVDILSFDGDDPDTPIEESLEAVDRLIRDGKVRFLSASRFTAARIGEAAQISRDSGFPSFAVVVVEYNLMDRSAYEAELAPIARELGRGAIVRLPHANGYLRGEFRSQDEIPENIVFDNARRHIGRRGNRVLAALAEVAAELETTSAAVALAWVLVKPGIAAAAVRVTHPEQLNELFGAATLPLTRQQVALLDSASDS